MPILINHRRVLTDDHKADLVNSFLGGESLGDAAVRLNVARASVEEAIREAILGLARLNQQLRTLTSEVQPPLPASEAPPV